MTSFQRINVFQARTIFKSFLSNVKYQNYCRTYSIKRESLSLSNSLLINYLDNVKLEYWLLHTAENLDQSGRKRLGELLPIVKVLEERECVQENIRNLQEITTQDTKDDEMRELVSEEKQIYEKILNQIEEKLLTAILPAADGDDIDRMVLEITAGVGGKEAMLFARELFDMYCGYMDYKGWSYQVAEYDTTELGGIRHASVLVSGGRSFRYLSYEAGVHRVQRVPATEKSGRIHTSTVSVAVLPQPDEVDIQIQNKDLRIETKRASGAGGQHVNTTDSAVRILHIPTGIAVECQTDRSQIKNREMAMDRLRAKLYEIQTQSQETTTKDMRKSQVGSSMRNEKIRTYNYNQDRVTDHRLTGINMHNIKIFMEGGESLQKLIDNLDENARYAMLDKLIEMANKQNTKK